MVVEAENIPPGSRFKGYRNYTIQELVIRSETTLYRLATWLLPVGKLLTAKLPVPLPAAGPGLAARCTYAINSSVTIDSYAVMPH